MTGLRISDILKLDWRDFEVGPDQGYYIRICTEKTETEATLSISQEALELCGEWGTGKVFKGLTRSITHHPLKQWIAEAGIRKHITFHWFESFIRCHPNLFRHRHLHCIEDANA